MSASGFTPAPASPEFAVAAETLAEKVAAGDTAPAARTLATSERIVNDETDSRVSMLPVERRNVLEDHWELPVTPERLNAGTSAREEALEVPGNCVAKATARAERATTKTCTVYRP